MFQLPYVVSDVFALQYTTYNIQHTTFNIQQHQHQQQQQQQLVVSNLKLF